MKSSLIFLFLLFQFCAFSQGNSDFEKGLELISQSEAADPFFQLDADDSNTMILEMNESRSINQNSRTRQLTNLLRDLKAENRNSFSRPIQIMTRQEINDHGYELNSATKVYGYRVDGETMNIILTTVQIDNREQYFADFRFLKKFGGWEIIGQNVRSSRH